MKMFWIVALIALGGCASTDYFGVMNSCQAEVREQEALTKSCQESTAVGVTDEMCEAIIIPNCQELIDAWNKHEERVLAREKKEAQIRYCTNQGLVRYCSSRGIPRPEDCGCITRDSMQGVFSRW